MNVEIANKLVSLRKQLGLSQEGLAEKIGVSRQAVSKWERSESSPDTDNLIALSRIYGISIDEMINYDINTKVVEKASTNSESLSYSDLDDSAIYNGDSYKEDINDDAIHNGDSYNEEDDDDTLSINAELKVDGKNLHGFPIAVLVTIIYLLLGIVFNLWHPGWLIFLIIPIFQVFTSPRKKGEGWKSLPYPVVCTVIFLLVGFLFNGWYYAWLIFLTIPLWGYFVKR